MGVAADNPFIEVGDVLQEFESWRLEGVNETNSDHGRVYIVSSATLVEVFRRAPRVNIPPLPADRVAFGPGGAGSWVTLSEDNNSGMSGLVYRTHGQPTSGIIVHKWLCGPDDLRRMDDRIDGMHIEGETTWDAILDEALRQFLLKFASIYPPPPAVSAPLRFTANEIEEGREGTPEWAAQYYWTLSLEGVWEMTGLQNPDDYRTMGIYKALALIYERKARAGDGTDPVFSRMMHYEEQAMKAFRTARPWVDIDRDKLPDRQTKTRTYRLRRG